MITKYKSGNVTWLDLESPTKDELTKIGKEYALHSVVLEDLVSQTLRQKADLYNDYMYAVFHFPTLSKSEVLHNAMDEEIDFIIGKNLIITTHYRTIDALYRVIKIFETSGTLHNGNSDLHAGHVFLKIMREMYFSLEAQIEHIGDHLRKVESGIFENEEKKMVSEISKINRIMINFRRSLSHHENMLSSFQSISKVLWEESFGNQVLSITNAYHKTRAAMEDYKEILNDLRNTNDSLLSSKINSTMKSLSMMALITFPLALIVALFSMPTASNPIHNHPQQFWIVITIMVIALIAMIGYFKEQRWI
ncbi:MAG: CorA family divalent cation transporter [Candidatus Vogelbacteria bacterium]|nr:CorA family divalent cation transporter [Candidatus Vogelbacteria bacterium]